jgi:copper transport protein
LRRLVALAVATAAAAPAAAGAHTGVRTSYPLDEDVVARAPERVSIRFDDRIEGGLGRIEVLDGDGARIDRGGTLDVGGDTIATRLATGLDRGTYTVSWRVVADDAHAQRGAFVFHVVAPGADPAGQLARVLAPPPAGAVARVAQSVRAAVFALLLLSVGGTVAILFVVGSSRRLWLALARVAALLAVAAAARVVLETAAGGGLSLAEATSRGVLRIALATRFGRWSLVEIAAAVVLAVAAAAAAGGRHTRIVAAVAALGLLVASPAMGHPVEAGAGAFVFDLLHVQAAAAWVGGLVFVLLALAFAAGDRWQTAARVVPRFSAIAVVQVPVLVAAGTLSGYFQLRGWWALPHTTYGRLVLAKAAIVLPLLALGALNRRGARTLRGGAADATVRRRFVTLAGAETALFAAVVALTAVLVGTKPGRVAAAEAAAARAKEARPFVAALASPSVIFQLTVTPAHAGANHATLYLNDRRDSRPVEGGPTTLLVTPAGGGTAPVRLRGNGLLPGQFSFADVPTPATGTWLFTFLVRRPHAPPAIQTFQVPIGR